MTAPLRHRLLFALVASLLAWAAPADAQPAEDEAPAADEAAPPAEEAPPPAPPADEDLPPDLSPLLADFEALMDELVQARSRIAVLGRQLFRTRVRVVVQDRTGRELSLDHVRIRLDGAPVFDAEGAEANVAGGRQVFDGVAAPGPHTLTLDVSHRARGEGAHTFVAERVTTLRFAVRQGELTTLTVVIDDDSDIGERFGEDGEGEYDLRTRVRVTTRRLPPASQPSAEE